VKMALFFTRGISLETWVNLGLIDREKLIYEKHLISGALEKVYWLTYGSNDHNLSQELKSQGRLHESIVVLPMPKIFSVFKKLSVIYSLILPFYYKDKIKECQVLKTNQMDGSWSAVIAKKILNKFLIVRTGFTLSAFSKKKKSSLFKRWGSVCVEKISYKYCDIATVSSNLDKQYLIDQRYLKSDKVIVVRNYIDINLFKPMSLDKYVKRVLFVGRLNSQKNLHNTIRAVSMSGLGLDIYGEGELKVELVDLVRNENLDVNFKGVVANAELPKIYNQYSYYILASHYEGMPKTLLEAMACGCLCIGTNVSGINEVLKDSFNGFLAKDTSSIGIFDAIVRSTALDRNIVKNSVKSISEKFSLECAVKLEKEILDYAYDA